MLKCKHIAAYPKEYAAIFQSPKDGVGDTIREFINTIERFTGNKGIKFRSDDDRLKFKGDVLEVLSEIWFTLLGAHPTYGLTEYTPIDITEDYGVDAKGNNANGDLSMVQVKYRGNPKDVVTYGEIANTYTSGVIQQGLDPTKEHNIFIFTTALNVSHQCEEVLGKRIVIINKPIIKMIIDNNHNFWKLAYDLILEYISYHSGSPSYTI